MSPLLKTISSSSNDTASRASAMVNLSHLSSPSEVDSSLVRNDASAVCTAVVWSHPRLLICSETLRTCSSSSWWTPSVLSCKSPCSLETEYCLSVTRLTCQSPRAWHQSQPAQWRPWESHRWVPAPRSHCPRWETQPSSRQQRCRPSPETGYCMR